MNFCDYDVRGWVKRLYNTLRGCELLAKISLSAIFLQRWFVPCRVLDHILLSSEITPFTFPVVAYIRSAFPLDFG